MLVLKRLGSSKIDGEPIENEIIDGLEKETCYKYPRRPN